MKTNQRQNSISSGVGIPSLLLIAVILCLTAFGVLAYVSARADLKLTDAGVETTQAYYAAHHDAQELLSRLDERLAAQSDHAQAVADAAALQSGTEVTGDTVSYTFPLGETTYLKMTVRIEPTGSAARYTVTGENIAESVTERDDTLNLWTGD